MQGNVSETVMHYIIRDHDAAKFREKKDLLVRTAEYLNYKYGNNTFDVEIKDQYLNMREKIEPVFGIVELAKKAIEEAGAVPKTIPIRGGTDGSRLSYMGLPCPNLFGGGHNFHSRFEFIPVLSMQKAVEVIVKICEKARSTAI
jgi:tripeptide aminopeptidase